MRVGGLSVDGAGVAPGAPGERCAGAASGLRRDGACVGLAGGFGEDGGLSVEGLSPDGGAAGPVRGGTGLLIVVSVALDMVQRIEANLLMRNYGGFLGGDGGKKRIKGRQY